MLTLVDMDFGNESCHLRTDSDIGLTLDLGGNEISDSDDEGERVMTASEGVCCCMPDWDLSEQDDARIISVPAAKAPADLRKLLWIIGDFYC